MSQQEYGRPWDKPGVLMPTFWKVEHLMVHALVRVQYHNMKNIMRFKDKIQVCLK